EKKTHACYGRSSDWLGPRASRPQTRRRHLSQKPLSNSFSRFALLCGRDASGPNRTLDRLSAGWVVGQFEKFVPVLELCRVPVLELCRNVERIAKTKSELGAQRPALHSRAQTSEEK